jgi:predicted transcriptional regulator
MGYHQEIRMCVFDTWNDREGSMPEIEQRGELVELTATIVEAHVSNNEIPVADLPGLIGSVYETLAEVGKGVAPRPEPAISVKRSVRPGYIVCLEDGLKHKMLKRHLRTAHELTPDAYRKRWGLAPDYPLVAPKYAELRSKLAKKIGLGRKVGTKMKRRRKA